MLPRYATSWRPAPCNLLTQMPLPTLLPPYYWSGSQYLQCSRSGLKCTGRDAWLADPCCPESPSLNLPEPAGLSLLPIPPLLPELTVLWALPWGLRESPRNFPGHPVSKVWGPGILAPISQEGRENPREQCSTCSPFKGSLLPAQWKQMRGYVSPIQSLS